MDNEAEKLLYDDDDASLALARDPRRKTSRQSVPALWWISNAVLLGIILFLLIDRPQSHTSSTIQIAGDIHEFWPALPRQVIEFQPNNRYIGNLSSPTFISDIKEHWLSLIPKGLGFVEVPANYASTNLPVPLIEFLPKQVYTTSVTHQLHCLFMIMHGFNDLALNAGVFKMDMAGSDADEGLTREGEDPAEHLGHCFDYLRQAIMCHGDMALEGRQTTFGEGVGGSDGWGAQHVCKPWDRIHDMLEERRVDDRVWI